MSWLGTARRSEYKGYNVGTYNTEVLASKPVLYLPAAAPSDASGYGHPVSAVAGSALAQLRYSDTIGSTAVSSVTSGAINVAAGSILLIFISVAAAAGAPTIIATSDTAGLTWTNYANVRLAASTQLSCIIAPTASAVTTTVTVGFAAPASVVWNIIEVPNVNQVAPLYLPNLWTPHGSGTTAAVTYFSMNDPRNVFLQAVALNSYTTQTSIQPDWYTLKNILASGPSTSLCTLVSPNPSELVGGTYIPFSSLWGTIGIEVNRTATVPPPPTIASVTLPNGDTSYDYNGSQWCEIPSSPQFSIPTTGSLTLEFWFRPDVLQFAYSEATGYVDMLGKGNSYGVTGNQEYLGRVYSLVNSESRPNRLSGYAFLPSGGLGVGSYFQDPMTTTDWIHVCYAYNTAPQPGVDRNGYSFDKGYTKIYKNGVMGHVDALDNPDLNVIVPVAGSAPLRLGSQSFFSFLQGAIGKFAVYPRELNSGEVAAHYTAMTGIPV